MVSARCKTFEAKMLAGESKNHLLKFVKEGLVMGAIGAVGVHATNGKHYPNVSPSATSSVKLCRTALNASVPDYEFPLIEISHSTPKVRIHLYSSRKMYKGGEVRYHRNNENSAARSSDNALDVLRLDW
jgi:hypothetical protein